MNKICRHLRNKKMYIDALAPEAFAEKQGEEASPNYHWCNLTQTAVGPDDRPVGIPACNPMRPCFEE